MVKVFISWSGDLSGDIAEFMGTLWLPSVLQGVKPYCTFPDFKKGEKWDPDTVNEIENSDIGIICLTEENLASPWILHEYYALSKKLGPQVSLFVFRSDPTPLTGPLANAAIRFEKSEFKKLVESINEKCAEGDKKTPEDLNQAFDDNWNDLDNKIGKVLKLMSYRLNSGVLKGLVSGYISLKEIVHDNDDENLRENFEKMQKSLDCLELLELCSCDPCHKEIWDTYRFHRGIKIIDAKDWI